MEDEGFNSDIEFEDDIFLDTVPLGASDDESKPSKPVTVQRKALPKVNEQMVNKMLKKAVIGSDFDQKPIEEVMMKSARAKRKDRRVIRDADKGKPWFNMPATELTDENRRDLELLQMRAEIDPKSQYRKTDLKVLPKYFQTGTIVDNSADYYSSRMTKKERKPTMVDELVNDYEFLAKNKHRYNEIKMREAQTHRRRVNPMNRFKKKDKAKK